MTSRASHWDHWDEKIHFSALPRTDSLFSRFFSAKAPSLAGTAVHLAPARVYDQYALAFLKGRTVTVLLLARDYGRADASISSPLVIISTEDFLKDLGFHSVRIHDSVPIPSQC
jgi:hypothetical protein